MPIIGVAAGLALGQGCWRWATVSLQTSHKHLESTLCNFGLERKYVIDCHALALGVGVGSLL